jgi:hypothetical protein
VANVYVKERLRVNCAAAGRDVQATAVLEGRLDWTTEHSQFEDNQ